MTFLEAIPESQPVRWTLLEARGEQTASFLQGQLSCDVLSLAPGDSVQGLLLAPSGEVITSLVARSHPQGVDVVVREEVGDHTLAALRRFLMRTKCDINVVGEVPGPYASVGEQVDLGEPGPAEFARSLAAHSFGMDFVARHVSFTKGCFTGQELVGRLDSRGGNVPFRFARVRGADVNEMRDVVLSAGPSGDRAQQGLTTLVGVGPFSALAIVHRTLLGDAREATVGRVHLELLHDGGTSGR